MTFLRFVAAVLCMQLFGMIQLQADQVFFIRDIWTDQPVSGAEIILSKITILSDDHGSFRITLSALDSTGLTIKKNGYFEITLQNKDFISPVIYLTPVENTIGILCVQPQLTDTPLRLPSHISHIIVNQSQVNSKNNAADILAEQSGIFMKSYGPPGSIQSISVRGMSPEQTQIMFDGVPVNSLQLGSVDLGYYPLQTIGSMDIYRGGSALFGGSGSIGGSIDLHPRPLKQDPGYDLLISQNSLNDFNVSGTVDLPLKTYLQRFFLDHAYGLNNYKTEYGNRMISLKNRDYKQILYGYQNKYDFSSRLSGKGYFSGYKREGGSPGAFIDPQKEKENDARSRVENYLYKIRLDYNIPGFGLHFQTYFRDEQMQYKDTTLVINYQQQHSHHKNSEGGVQIRVNYLLSNKLLLNSGIETALQDITSTDAGRHSRKRGAYYLYGDYQILSNSLNFIRSVNINGSVRYEYYSGYGGVLLPGFGANIQGSFWQVYVAGSRNYRIPSFNELYWRPGGNGDLHPEESLNFETGAEFKNNISRYLLYNIQIALYENRVDDQIKWLPDGSVWTPQNISEVLSKGLELDASLSDLADNHVISFNYRYGISEKRKAEVEGDETIGNQLPFLPREQVNVNARTIWRHLKFGVDFSHISFRYKTIQNEAGQILPAYSLFNAWTGFDFNLDKNKISLALAISNLFDTNYEVMNGYPMPGRNYTLTLSSEF